MSWANFKEKAQDKDKKLEGQSLNQETNLPKPGRGRKDTKKTKDELLKSGEHFS